AEAWIDAFLDPSLRAATGPVEHGDGGTAVDWAVFFCEYAPFLDSDRAVVPARLAGNNFALRKQRDDIVGGTHESAATRQAIRRGERLATAPAARARHVRRYAAREALRDRLRFGFEYGQLRAAGWTPGPRFLACCAGPAIVLSQVARLVVT